MFHLKSKPLLILATLALLSCEGTPLTREHSLQISNPSFKGQVRYMPLSSRKGFKLSLIDEHNNTTDQTFFQYEPYRLDTADVDHDGNTDVLVGLIKPTQFDPVEKKRLFIMRVDDGQLRPLWLGSKVCQELIDFKPAQKGVVTTLEKTKNGAFAIGKYEWQGFGLGLIHYTHQDITFDHASQIFNH